MKIIQANKKIKNWIPRKKGNNINKLSSALQEKKPENMVVPKQKIKNQTSAPKKKGKTRVLPKTKKLRKPHTRYNEKIDLTNTTSTIIIQAKKRNKTGPPNNQTN